MRVLSALALLVSVAGLVGCNALAGARAAPSGGGSAPTVVWSGPAQAYTDGTFETPTEMSPRTLRVALYADGQSRDGAAGTLHFGGALGDDPNCVYRLTRAGTRTEGAATIINFDAAYAGTLDLAAIADRAVATLACSQASTHGRLITTPLEEGLLVAYVGELSGGGTVHFRGVLPVVSD